MPTLTGTDGADVLDAHGANGLIYDLVEGKAGDDKITAAAQALPSQGNDTIIGNGNTTLLYWDSPAGIRFNFSTGIAEDGWGTIDHFTGVNEVMTTRFDDDVIGSDANETVMFAGAGKDTIALGGGIDTVKINVQSDAAYQFSKQADGSWLVKYDARDQPGSSTVLKDVERVQFYDSNWNLLSEWELFGNTPSKITAESRANPILRTELASRSAFWNIDSKLVYKIEVADQHLAGYYPTPNDTYPAGYNSIELLHNVTVGEFDGKPGQDLLLYPAMFPHLLEHRPVKPILMLNTGSDLQASSIFDDAVIKGRQHAYRTQAVDYNGDGRLDAISSEGITGDQQKGRIDSPILAVTSLPGGGWRDTTTSIAGQTGYSDNGVNMFGHDFASGDINGDGRPDFLTGNFLFLNQGDGNFSNASKLLGRAATIREEKFAMSSLLTDVNRDGFDDLVFWMSDPIGSGYLFLNNAGKGFENVTPSKLTDGVFGVSNTKFNHAIAGDFNHDGINEIVMGETRAAPYYRGRVVEILVSDGQNLMNGTVQRIPDDPRKNEEIVSGSTGSGEGQLFVVDVNGDGHPDIVDSGTRVLLNDGEGFFIDMPQAVIPRANSSMLSGWLGRDSSPDFRLVPIDLDGKNGIDWIGEIVKPITTSPQSEPTVNFLYSITSTARYGKAGGGVEGASLGAPGFDEAYYLRQHPELVPAIAEAKFKSAIDHYLNIGKAANYSAFAPNTTVWGSERGDSLNLQTGSEIYYGGAGNDSVSGLAGNDQFTGAGGDDYFDGGTGVDTAVYSNSLAQYLIHKSQNNFTVKALSGNEGVDTLHDVELIKFKDFSVNLSIQEKAMAAPPANVQRLMELYVAFFNRMPDSTGLEYWIDQMRGGQKLDQIANSFYAAGVTYSALTGFSASMSNEAFINIVYKNVLGRLEGADAGGLNYWGGELSSGRASRGTLVSTILDSAHGFKGDAIWGWVANLLDNKIAVAKTVAIDWGLSYNDAASSITQGMQICAAITSTDTSKALSLVGIPADNFHLY